VSPDGTTVFVTGTSGVTTGGDPAAPDYATVAYERTTGAQVWVERYDGPSNGADFANSIGVSPDGTTVFVTGPSIGPLPYEVADFATVAYDASTGHELWMRRWDGPAGAADGARALAVSPDSVKLFVTGSSSRRSGVTDYATVAYATDTGAKLWVRRYGGPGNSSFDYPKAIAVSPDGRTVFVTGYSGIPTSDRDYATVAYRASSGSTQWIRRYDGPSHRDDYGSAIAVSPHGARVFVTGNSRGRDGSVDYATVGYETSTGSEIWVRPYDGPGGHRDLAYSAAVSPVGGTMFITGESQGISTYDFATIAYVPRTGAVVWIARYDRPAQGDDFGRAVAASPDGMEVFVTGASRSGSDDFDFATVSYEA
jgi:hypothetical protein